MITIKNIYIPIAVLLVLFLSSCSKYTEKKTSATGDTIIVTIPDTTKGTTTNSGPAYIKFFNTLYDYNAVTCSLNGATVASVSDFYPSGYIPTLSGINEIKLFYQTTATTVLDINASLTGGGYYSCFLYKVGYDWKVSIIKDNLIPPVAGYYKVRTLDFRTQAYFDYVKTRIYYPGNVSEVNQTGRHFLDHTTYDSYTRFDSLPSGKYNVMIYNDSVTLAKKTDFNFMPGKIYSVVLTTATNLSSSAALYNIQMDIEAHN